MKVRSSGRASRNLRKSSRVSGYSLEVRPLEDGRRAQGEQSDHGAHLQPLGAPVRQPQHIIEEAVVLIPHAGVFARVAHRRGDPQEMLGELDRQVLIGGTVLRQLHGDLEHILAEERHPGSAVGLLQIAAGWQRRAAVEDPDVVQPQEAALKDVVAGAVFTVHPPGEVEQQLLEGPLEPVEVPLTVSSLLQTGR